MIAGASALKILEERGITVWELGDQYFDAIHTFMPIISRTRFNKRAQELTSNGAFWILTLAILLVTEIPTKELDEIFPTHASLPELYKVCKYHFSLFLSFKGPSIELIQAGLCIALYEHGQYLGDSACLTVGSCAKMLSLLGFHPSLNHTAQSADTEDPFDESAHIAMATELVERYLACTNIQV
jgi:hypothetical protein